VSVSLFKRTGFEGEYSVHDKCKMYNMSDVELTSGSYEGQRRYQVSKGQQVKAEFTWENNGETWQTRNVGWYISTDSTITTADTRIVVTARYVDGSTPYALKTTVTLPSNLTSGTTYYLGAIFDYDGGLAETDENNNAAYHIIRVNY
jgi:hypothetical protein